jgi:mitochondrial fission protein ELM1
MHTAPHTQPASMSPVVWALLDERAGNTAQTRGIAQALGYPFHEKPLRYNALVHLPNALRGASWLGIPWRERNALVQATPHTGCHPQHWPPLGSHRTLAEAPLPRRSSSFI